MLIIIDIRIPLEAKANLSRFGELIEFSTDNITYPAISCHPDIFLCQTPEALICAPNIPSQYLALFTARNIRYKIGIKNVGQKYPASAAYNGLVNGDYVFHKKEITDLQILKHSAQKRFIDLNQGYTRCGLIQLPSGICITSDKGIEKALRKAKIEVHYFHPSEILLPEMKHGFIGGALGVYQDKVFAIGNPKHHLWGEEFIRLISHQGLELISLYDGPFIDGGGIFFLEP